MRFEPIIRARLNAFRTNFGFKSQSDDKAYELFLNYSILEKHQPDSVSSNIALLDFISVGGPNDMGIDGLAIKVNGMFITSIKELNSILELQRKIDCEFIFIQSKNKNSIDSGEFAKFADGIIDFLSDEHCEPRNEKINELLKIKERIFEDEVILRMNAQPSIWVYYAIFGDWRESTHIEAKAQNLEHRINYLNAYSMAVITYIDNQKLKKICEENEHAFSAVINIIASFELTEVKDVKNSLIVLCTASELIKVISTEDGLMRKSLFTDNVRDYQGDTEINGAIMQTLKKTPSNFTLLNNGITIVCTSLLPSNRKITLQNPQIVNGCQTCHVLFEAFQRDHIDISSVTIVAKIIGTDSDDLTNSIVRGTNSQNTVSVEAFETTREFHKDLEDFFNIIQKDESFEEKVYYERRSRQYNHLPSIPQTRIINVDTMLRSFVSIFLQQPHNTTKHIQMLLRDYKNVIFMDGQSRYPYYIACKMCVTLEHLVRQEKLNRDAQNYKFHILLLASEKIAGRVPSINDSKKIDAYCEKLIPVIQDDEVFAERLADSVKSFHTIASAWTKQLGEKYKHGIKDNAQFTRFLILYLRGEDLSQIGVTEEPKPQYRGLVVKTKRDRNGYYYGFIKRYPEDVFFHQRDNADIDFDSLYGHTVTYTTFIDSYNGDERAVINDILQDSTD